MLTCIVPIPIVTCLMWEHIVFVSVSNHSMEFAPNAAQVKSFLYEIITIEKLYISKKHFLQKSENGFIIFKL
jgi:hypothetical protein